MTLKWGDGYDPLVSIKKFITGWAITVVPITITYSIGFLETEQFPEEFALWVPIMVGILHMLSNAWKHWHDTTE